MSNLTITCPPCVDPHAWISLFVSTIVLGVLNLGVVIFQSVKENHCTSICCYGLCFCEDDMQANSKRDSIPEIHIGDIIIKTE